MSSNVKVTLSMHWGDHLPGDVISVTPDEAKSLRNAGYVATDAAGISAASGTTPAKRPRRPRKAAAKKTATPAAPAPASDAAATTS